MAITTVDGSFITDNTVDGTKLALASQAAGDVMYYNGTDWIRLAKGTADQVLTMNDGATAPQWEAAAAGGDLSFGGDTFGANKIIGSNDNYSLAFETNNTTRMTLGTGGNIGIGTVSLVDSYGSSAHANLQIHGTGDASDSCQIDKYHLLLVNPANDTNEEIGIGFRISDNQQLANNTMAGAAITHERTGGSSQGKLHFKTSPTAAGTSTLTRMTIDQNGAITAPAQPAFAAYNSSADNNVTGHTTTATVDFDTELFDQGSDFDNDTFTAPVTGRYLITSQIRIGGTTTGGTYSAGYFVASNRTWDFYMGLNGVENADNPAISMSAIIDMDAADTVIVRFLATGMGSDIVDILGGSNPQTFVTGYLVA